MTSIVGGIFYRPQHKKELKDIYDETIDLSNLLSYRHSPVTVTTPIQSSYSQPYVGFNKPSETDASEEPAVTELIAPTMIIANEPATKKSYSSNESA
jgi:hypothetical protein